MNHVAIVLKQLREKADKVRGELAGIEAAIVALGGTVSTGAVSAPKARRRRTTAGASASASTAAPRPARTRNSAANGADSPELIAELKAISEDPNLHGIQKAQASRKARAKYKRGDVAPARPEGAVLGEAAAAEA